MAKNKFMTGKNSLSTMSFLNITNGCNGNVVTDQLLSLNGRFSKLTSRSLKTGDCLLLLRVVRCLPLLTVLPGTSRTLRAGVGQASREETAGSQ
jgi:hypothetical protein